MFIDLPPEPAKPTFRGRPRPVSPRALLTPLSVRRWAGGDRYRPGAVVVPTSRPSHALRSGLAFASRLAVTLGCPLVVLATKDAATPAAVDALERQITVEDRKGGRQPDGLLLFPSASAGPLTTFETTGLLHPGNVFPAGHEFAGGRGLPASDVGRKRNLGLLLARACGWRSVLFLDDDVFDDVDGAGRGHGRHPLTLDIPTLRAGVRAVEEGHLAVGWAAKDFDDNSVLCRMAGQLGAPLGQFLGGGALLARVDERTPFFPSIYNEDWLFMLALLERRIAGSGQVLDAGDVHQDAYAPYAHTRAVGEELGDVLGEGMLSLLLQTDDRRKPLDSAFWRGELRSRRRFKDEIRRRVTADDHPSRTEMLAALSAVDDLHAGLERDEDTWVDRFVAYVEAWGRDREAWARRLRLDDVPSAAQLLESAEFAGVAPLGASSSISEFVRRSAPPPVRTAGRVAARL